jgi:hypothetical protein
MEMIMSRNHTFVSKTQQPLPAKKKPVKKLYHKPCLEKLGDLRTLTLGGSIGFNDSINPGVSQPASHRIPPSFPNPGGFPQPGDPNWTPPKP